MDLLSILTFASLVALAADIVMQHMQIRKTKSSKDVSIWGAEIRLVAIVILLIKFYEVHDVGLFLGQAVILVVFVLYLADVRRMGRKNRKKK